MTAGEIWVCPACGANYPPADAPPAACDMCQDERQWVPADGQRWTTIGELRAGNDDFLRRPPGDRVIVYGVGGFFPQETAQSLRQQDRISDTGEQLLAVDDDRPMLRNITASPAGLQ